MLFNSLMMFFKICNVLINCHDNEIGCNLSDSSMTNYCHNFEYVLELVIPTLSKFAGNDEHMTVKTTSIGATSEIGG